MLNFICSSHNAIVWDLKTCYIVICTNNSEISWSLTTLKTVNVWTHTKIIILCYMKKITEAYRFRLPWVRVKKIEFSSTKGDYLYISTSINTWEYKPCEIGATCQSIWLITSVPW